MPRRSRYDSDSSSDYDDEDDECRCPRPRRPVVETTFECECDDEPAPPPPPPRVRNTSCDCGSPPQVVPCPATSQGGGGMRPVMCNCDKRKKKKKSKSPSSGGICSFFRNLTGSGTPKKRRGSRKRDSDSDDGDDSSDSNRCECLQYHQGQPRYLSPETLPPPKAIPPERQPIMLLVEPKVMRVLSPEELQMQESMMRQMGGVYKSIEDKNEKKAQGGGGGGGKIDFKIDLGDSISVSVPVIWVLGGPGSGKGTQCDKIVADYHFEHISTGDLLRNEVKNGTELGKNLDEVMKSGALVPFEPVLKLLKDEIKKKLSGAKGFLIDGYPRTAEQGEKFEKHVCKCTNIIYFEVSDSTMMDRLKKRGESSGRADDNEDTIRKRIKTFHEESEPVMQKYGSKVIKISAEAAPEAVYDEVKKEMDKITKKDEGGDKPPEEKPPEPIPSASPSGGPTAPAPADGPPPPPGGAPQPPPGGPAPGGPPPAQRTPVGARPLGPPAGAARMQLSAPMRSALRPGMPPRPR